MIQACVNYYYQQVLLKMNYNISNNLNFAQFLPSKPENKNNQTQILLLLISTALKQSLAFYQLQWKSTQLSPNQPKSINIQTGSVSQGYLQQNKKAQQKNSSIVQQNKKSIQKISYNSKIQKNDKFQQKNDENQMLFRSKNTAKSNDQCNSLRSHQKTTNQKIIHQNIKKEKPHDEKQIKKDDQGLIDLYQGAYIPRDQLSNKEIEQKREKLLLRKVVNWKQIDKKVGFRKMELKKLLT